MFRRASLHVEAELVESLLDLCRVQQSIHLPIQLLNTPTWRLRNGDQLYAEKILRAMDPLFGECRNIRDELLHDLVLQVLA